MPRRKPKGRSNAELRITDPGIRTRFFEAVKGGTPMVHAARFAGVSERSVQRWAARGADAEEKEELGGRLNEDEQICLEFLREYRDARAQVVVRNMALIASAARGGQLIERRTLPNGTVEEKYAGVDWRAADLLLKRSYPQEFAEAQRMELSGPGGGPVRLESPAAAVLARQLREAMERSPADDVIELEADQVQETSVEVFHPDPPSPNGVNGNGHLNGHGHTE